MNFAQTINMGVKLKALRMLWKLVQMYKYVRLCRYSAVPGHKFGCVQTTHMLKPACYKLGCIQLQLHCTSCVKHNHFVSAGSQLVAGVTVDVPQNITAGHFSPVQHLPNPNIHYIALAE